MGRPALQEEELLPRPVPPDQGATRWSQGDHRRRGLHPDSSPRDADPGQAYRDLGNIYYLKRDKEKIVARLARQARELGYELQPQAA